MHDINWEVFTQEEHAALNKMIELRAYNEFALAIGEMDQTKEKELQKLVNHFKPIVVEQVSDVMKKYVAERREQGLVESPQSPEEEIALQKLLDEEMRAKQEEARSKTEVVPKEPEVPELVVASKFCDTCDSKGVKHKKDCPTYLNK